MNPTEATPGQETSASVEADWRDRELRPLRRDIRLLDMEWADMLRRLGADGLIERVREFRQLARERRNGDEAAGETLRRELGALSLTEIADLGRAVSCFFDLANLAEDRHRVRVLRQREQRRHLAPRSESVGEAFQQLKSQGCTAGDVRKLLDDVHIELVFTAHPTEAKRRTIRRILRRVRENLQKLDRMDLLQRRRKTLIERIRGDLGALWQTDNVRGKRPTVRSEVNRSLFTLDTIWQVLPELTRNVRDSFEYEFPGEEVDPTPVLSFGSWIGGDRDGNPNVTTEVTVETLERLRAEALGRHLESAQSLKELLTLSSAYSEPGAALREAIAGIPEFHKEAILEVPDRNPEELYRFWLTWIYSRLEQTMQVTVDGPEVEFAYRNAAELIADVSLLSESLRAAGQTDLAGGHLQDWLDRLRTFGFHMARLDIREHSEKLQRAVAEVARELDLSADYLGLDEDGRQQLLGRPLEPAAAQRLDIGRLSEETRQTLELMEALERWAARFGQAGLGAMIVSMTHQPSDVLVMLWLSRLAAAREGHEEPAAQLPVSPLFETIGDLQHSADTLDRILANPLYAKHLRAGGNRQICMIGYSDSTKDGGFLAAAWYLYEAQRRLASAAEARGVALTFFHGRGGSLGRGGGPAARAILSLPPQTVNGQLRITEQGEVLAERYDDPEIAFRHLEQVTYATLLVSSKQERSVPLAHEELMHKLADRSLARYRALIEHPDFLDYFSRCTPIETIESLLIGSRPARRGGERKLENLRAIPYTFAWTQSRHMVNAFFGLGAAADALSEVEWCEFQAMYQDSPMFHAVIHGAELALVKADLGIAHRYSELMGRNAQPGSVWSVFESEFVAARRAVFAATGHQQLLEGAHWLQRSVRRRNPDVDVLNFIQVELMRRRNNAAAAGDTRELEEIDRQLRHSVQGIAAGLRTTG
jgi:phosphoenolpyruvate carboxylase